MGIPGQTTEREALPVNDGNRKVKSSYPLRKRPRLSQSNDVLLEARLRESAHAYPHLPEESRLGLHTGTRTVTLEVERESRFGIALMCRTIRIVRPMMMPLQQCHLADP